VDIPNYATRFDPVRRMVPLRRLVHRVVALMGLPQHRRLAFALVAALGSALVFARITEHYLTNDPLARWDVSLAAWFADHQSTAGADAFRGITNLGSPLVCLVIATIVCLVLYRRQHIADAALLPVVLGGAELLNLVLKLSFHRDRPEHGVVHLDTYSYPSGHAMIAAATYGAFAYLLWGRVRAWRARAVISVGMLVLVIVICFSRVYLGVHYLSDVLGGAAAGATWLAFSIALQAAYGERFVAYFAGSHADRFLRRRTRS